MHGRKQQMPTFETVNHSPAGPHTHDAGLQAAERECPYCGHPISRKQYREIRARIEAEERTRIAKLEQTLRERFAREIAQAEAKRKADVEKARKDAAKAAEKAKTEAINAEKTKFFGEKLKLEQQPQEMQRRLQ